MRRLALCLAIAGVFWGPVQGASAQTQALPQCRIGLHVERARALNYPATIDAYDAAKGAWHVKYDNGGLPLLIKGYEGADWQVTFSGVKASDKRDQLNVERMDIGLNYLATRMR